MEKIWSTGTRPLNTSPAQGTVSAHTTGRLAGSTDQAEAIVTDAAAGDEASLDTGGRVAATISTTRTMIEVAQTRRESACRLTATTGDVVCALRRATSPLASQVRYNEEVGKDAIESMAA